MSINPSCKRENCTTIGWHVHREPDALSERIAAFIKRRSAYTAHTEARRLLTECQAEIERLKVTREEILATACSQCQSEITELQRQLRASESRVTRMSEIAEATVADEWRDSIIAQSKGRFMELQEMLLRASRGSMVCSICKLPVIFEFTVESSIWNRIVRAKGIGEYLCFWCFGELAVRDGEHDIRVGVNINGLAISSNWCGDDVPGAYPDEPTKAELQRRVQLFEDAKYPEEIARLERTNKWVPDMRARQFLSERNEQLKTQLERAEALLRRCEDEGWACLPEIAAHFRENKKS